MSGIGGVQSQFEIFLKNCPQNESYQHQLLTASSVDHHYPTARTMAKNIYINMLNLWMASRSSRSIVHSYNNLTSEKAYKLFRLFRPQHLAFHERGNAWNCPSKVTVVKKNSELAQRVFCNSHATKTLLIQKFGVAANKLRVLYNGVIDDQTIEYVKSLDPTPPAQYLTFGYIGRLESNKGVHTLIQAFQKFNQSKKHRLKIIGDGSLRPCLENLIQEDPQIQFIGRVEDPFKEISSCNIMVVPSIREPLGNVIIETALCRVPVIAAAVDGIPEIVENDSLGKLITPTESLQKEYMFGNVPIPEVVYDPKTKQLNSPKELSVEQLVEEFQNFEKNPQPFLLGAENLYHHVITKFHINEYIKDLMGYYREMLN
jgi:glycosyltransferase involved in cell wall biosynthesis